MLIFPNDDGEMEPRCHDSGLGVASPRNPVTARASLFQTSQGTYSHLLMQKLYENEAAQMLIPGILKHLILAPASEMPLLPTEY